MSLSAAQIAEINRKVNAGIPLAGNGAGQVSAESLAMYQQLQTAKLAAAAASTSNQATGGGVGATAPTPNYPANTLVPDNVSSAVKGYGFTAIVGLGVALLVFSLVSSFRRVRGR